MPEIKTLEWAKYYFEKYWEWPEWFQPVMEDCHYKVNNIISLDRLFLQHFKEQSIQKEVTNKISKTKFDNFYQDRCGSCWMPWRRIKWRFVCNYCRD